MKKFTGKRAEVKKKESIVDDQRGNLTMAKKPGMHQWILCEFELYNFPLMEVEASGENARVQVVQHETAK